MLVIGNLPWYMGDKSYHWFDEVIAKIKWCSFFDSHGVCVCVRSVVSLQHVSGCLPVCAVQRRHCSC